MFVISNFVVIIEILGRRFRVIFCSFILVFVSKVGLNIRGVFI